MPGSQIHTDGRCNSYGIVVLPTCLCYVLILITPSIINNRLNELSWDTGAHLKWRGSKTGHGVSY